MNKETKFLIEEATKKTQTDLFENIKDLKASYSNYRANLARLESYAETLGFSRSHEIDVLGFSIEEIEKAKDQAVEGELLWRHYLEKAAWERLEAKRGETDENL